MRVVTWNVQGRVGKWPGRQDAIKATLADLAPDVIMLQESWVEPNGETQAEILANHLDFSFVTAAELAGFARFPQASYWVVNAIVTRWPSQVVRAIPLLDENGESTWRHVLIANIDRPEIEGGPFLVAGTHLEHGVDRSPTRLAQMAHLLSEVSDSLGGPDHWRSERPAIVGGDFNAVPWSDEIRAATGAAAPLVPGFVLVDAWEACGSNDRGATWSSDNPLVPQSAVFPNRRLDYITTTFPRQRKSGWFVSASLAGTTPINGVQPSDHYAVVAEVQL